MAQQQIILNRLCDLQGTNFEVIDVKVFKDKIIWQIEHKDDKELICRRCGEIHTDYHDWRWITLKDHSYGNRQCFWMVKRYRINCPCWHRAQVEYLSFRSKHHNLTKRFVDHIEQVLCSKMFTVADVARLYDLDYGVVYKIDHEVLLRLIQKREIPDPVNIAVDEKSFKKRHNYVTIVTDTDTSDVIWVSKGNTQESLDEFFKAIGPERCQKIKTVSKDLHKAYIASCLKYIPHATEVADPFHVVKRLNQAIDECRKELSVGSRLKVSKRKTIDNMQWVLRYKQENMKAGHLESLEDLQKINLPLYKAYLHKETFYDFFEFKPSQITEAKNFLIKWTVDAIKIGLNGLYEFAKYIMTHQKLLLNIVRTQRNSAISEGINRKISVIKNMAYGYRNIQYFMLKILQRCGVLGSLWEPAP